MYYSIISQIYSHSTSLLTCKLVMLYGIILITIIQEGFVFNKIEYNFPYY